MIERLLVAQRALGDGQLDHAERLFRQVADADERNAIAVVGLAEVALARGDRSGATALAARALEIDPDDAAAARIRMEAAAGEAVAAEEPTRPVAGEAAAPAEAAAPGDAGAPAEAAAAGEPAATAGRPSIVVRLRAWLAGALRRRA